MMSHRDKSITPNNDAPPTVLPARVYDAAARDGCDMHLFRRAEITEFEPSRTARWNSCPGMKRK